MGEVYSNPVSGGGIYAGRHRLAGNHRIYLWGQSNAVGRADTADISASPLSSDAGLATYFAGTFSRVFIWNGSAYVNLNGSNNLCDTNQFGPEFGLAVRWMRETTSGNLYIEKDAVGGTEILWWVPSAPYHYAAAITNHNAANAWFSANGVTVTNDAWAWIQGEGDDTKTESYYTGKLNELIGGLTTDGLLGTSTKRLLFQIPAGTVGYNAGVVAAKNAVAAASPSNTIAPPMPPYMKADNLHQNGRGIVQTGYDIFEYAFGKSHIAT